MTRVFSKFAGLLRVCARTYEGNGYDNRNKKYVSCAIS